MLSLRVPIIKMPGSVCRKFMPKRATEMSERYSNDRPKGTQIGNVCWCRKPHNAIVQCKPIVLGTGMKRITSLLNDTL